MFLAAFADQAHATWTIEPDHLGAQIERFLYSRPAVVKEREKRVIAHALNGREVWLGKDHRHFRQFQITVFRYRYPLDRDVEDFHAFSD